MSIIKKIPLNSPKDERGFSWFPFNDFPQFKKKELETFQKIMKMLRNGSQNQPETAK